VLYTPPDARLSESAALGGGAADAPRSIPICTYRLQLNSQFTFADACAVLPYLQRLGISHCYTSPYFAAQPGSTHGYDVGDYNAFNPDLGGEAGFERFVAALHAHAMGHVLDFVPNHMGIDPRSNPWWRDVLENGACSPSARFFDIDWAPLKDELADKLLLPILGDQYGTVLERGELRLSFDDGRLVLNYYDHQLPVNPRCATLVYRHALRQLHRDTPNDDPSLAEFRSILVLLENMPVYTASDPVSIAQRRRDKEIGRQRLSALVNSRPRIRAHIGDAIQTFNGEPGRPESFDRLHELLEAQPYRLAYWRTAFHEINYRRFFDINSLVGLRVEIPEAFEATHRLLFRLMKERKVDCIRVDHPDGLLDPGRYFGQLQELAARAWERDVAAESGRPAYVIAEKILSFGESLPESWAVHGTVGYEFLNDVNGLFVCTEGANRLRDAYIRLTGRDESFEDVVYESKRLIMATALASELNVLARELNRISETDRRSRDFTLNGLRDALSEFVACLSVYRTYVSETGWGERDRAAIDEAIIRARRRNPALEWSVFDFIHRVLLPRRAAPEEGRAAPYDPETQRQLRFSMRVQQYTAPVQAKGVEDTAFYRYNVLLSLNEVGGDPTQFGRTTEMFHEANRTRHATRPFGMLTTATHDAKLGEDVRARLNVLSELDTQWRGEVTRWMNLTRGACCTVEGHVAPDPNDRYRFFQVLLGIWPAEANDAPARIEVAPAELVDRVRAYMIKSVREAKLHTSWLNKNEPYERATTGFVEHVLAGPAAGSFLSAFLPFQRRIARLGMVNSLAQTVLKMTAPGIPDVYQGTELWDLSLVDPDNRDRVDFGSRSAMLAELESILPPLDGPSWPAPHREAVVGLLKGWPDGRIKMFVTACGLRTRQRHRELFLKGAYIPLHVDVASDAGVVAFARVLGQEAVFTLVPRLFATVIGSRRTLPVGNCWRTSSLRLPNPLSLHSFLNVFTGETVRPKRAKDCSRLPVAHLLAACPVGLFEAVD
jgi:(1->4)-alpha-D-glucan 1-alpha-D-glucosylmutase